MGAKRKKTRKITYRTAGVGIFLLLVILILIKHENPVLTGASQISSDRHSFIAKKIVRGFLTVQEITASKEYINGISLRFKTFHRKNTNNNVLVVVDSNLNLVYQEQFPSAGIENNKYRDFNFRESKRVGKGNKLYVCFYSSDGDTSNSIAPMVNLNSAIGKSFISVIIKDEPVSSIQYKAFGYPGGFFIKVYESDTKYSGFLIKSLWIAGCFLLCLVICFFPAVRDFIIRMQLKPEYLYIICAGISGIVLVFLIPPFQVPDELVHFSRAYEISEFQFGSQDKTIPASVYRLESGFTKLKFYPEGKTSFSEITESGKISLDPEVTAAGTGPDYIVPYIPQVFGVWMGRLLHQSPLIILYLGRLMNLLISVILVYLAIRKIPFFKWVIFLLALMPKTIYQFSSMSYDAVTIGISFLLISWFLFYVFSAEKISWKDLIFLFIMWILLAMCKPPYFIIGLLFLILPASRIGKVWRYVILGAVMILPLVFLLFAQNTISNLFRQVAIEQTEETRSGPQSPALNPQSPAPDPQSPTPNPLNKTIDPAKQLNYIWNHLTAYLKLVARTNFMDMRDNILKNFVGTTGWLDTFLPPLLVYLFLVILLCTAMTDTASEVSISILNRIFFLLIFLAGLLAAETSMYLYTTYVGLDKMFGIQGRYFIPLAPLFLLIFQNNTISSWLNSRLSLVAVLKQQTRGSNQVFYSQKSVRPDQLFTRSWQYFLLLFVIVSLVINVFTVYFRYYIP